MPIQPPTRPHSANPHARLDYSIFPRPQTPSSASSSRPQAVRSTSLYTAREADWDDAWDSSSDVEEAEGDPRAIQRPLSRPSSSTDARGVSIPAPVRRATADAQGVAASWTSASFQHVHLSDTSPPPSPQKYRPVLSSAKTFTEGAKPPLPGTDEAALGRKVASPTTTTANGASQLPPGGPWELVEEAELREEPEAFPTINSGKEAVRDDVDNIINGESSWHR